MTMYTQAQMDEVIAKQRAFVASMSKLTADNDAQTVKLLRTLREHVEAGATGRALHLIDSLVEANAPK